MHPAARPYQSIALPGRERLEHWHERIPPLYLVAASIVVGDATGLSLHLSLWPAIALTVAALSLFACRRPGWGMTVALGAIALAAGHASAGLYSKALLPNDIRRFPENAQVHLEGILNRAPERVNNSWRLYMRLQRAAAMGSPLTVAAGEVRVIVGSDAPYAIGQRLVIDGRLRFPRNLGNPGEFNYAAYLARQGIAVTALARPEAVAIVGQEPAGIQGRVEALRKRIGGLIDRELEQPQRGEMRALIIGDQGQLQPGIRQAFALTGMAHLLVISGLHLGFVSGAAFALVRLICWLFPYLLIRGWANKLAAGGGGLAALAYAAIAGGRISTLRALIMVLCYVAAVLADRPRELMASLALAALLICLLFPGSSLDIGFQLSFAAVAAVLLGMRRLAAREQRQHRPILQSFHARPALTWAAKMVVGAGAVSFFAMLGTAPLTAYYFNQFSLVGLVANAVVVPIIALGGVIVGLCAAGLGLFWQTPALMLLRLSSQAITLGNRLAFIFLALPGAWLRSFTPTLLELILIYLLLILWLTAPQAPTLPWSSDAPALASRRWRRAAALLCLLALTGDSIWWLRQRYFNPSLRVDFLALGQGASAALVEFPGSAVMLIYGADRMASPTLGEREIAPFLWSRKILHVDYLVLRQPEHFRQAREASGSLQFIADNFHPAELWTSAAIANQLKSDYLLDWAQRATTLAILDRAAPVRHVRTVSIRCLNPPTADRANRADGGLVLQIAAGKISFVLTGELDRTTQRQLLQSYPQLRATVLEVPHHASLNAFWEPFVKTVAPLFAVASVGYWNRYHSPACRLVKGYRTAGVRLLRTDREGAICFRLEGEQLRWSTSQSLLGPN